MGQEKRPNIFDVAKRVEEEDLVSFSDLIEAVDGPEAFTPEGYEAVESLLERNLSGKAPRHIA
jgi:hypothetical protein